MLYFVEHWTEKRKKNEKKNGIFIHALLSNEFLKKKRSSGWCQCYFIPCNNYLIIEIIFCYLELHLRLNIIKKKYIYQHNNFSLESIEHTHNRWSFCGFTTDTYYYHNFTSQINLQVCPSFDPTKCSQYGFVHCISYHDNSLYHEFGGNLDSPFFFFSTLKEILLLGIKPLTQFQSKTFNT